MTGFPNVDGLLERRDDNGNLRFYKELQSFGAQSV